MTKKLIILLCLIIPIAFRSEKVFAYNENYYKALAGFIYNFPKMIKSEGGDFCAYGYDQVVLALKDQYRDTILFRDDAALKSGFEKAHCAAIYISGSKSETALAIIIANSARVISIGTDDDFIQRNGAALVRMGRRNFELTINHETIRDFKVKFDPLAASLIVN